MAVKTYLINNVVPGNLSVHTVSLRESKSSEWLAENFYEVEFLIPAVCARMVARGTDPYEHEQALKEFMSSVCDLGPAQTHRQMFGVFVAIVYHRDRCNSRPYELVAY